MEQFIDKYLGLIGGLFFAAGILWSIYTLRNVIVNKFYCVASSIVTHKRHLWRFQPVRGFVEKALLRIKKNDVCIRHIPVQLVQGCNYRCDFCPHKFGIERKLMKWEVLRNLIGQLKRANYAGRISPYLADESLLHPDFMDMALYIAQSLPAAKIDISTNCSLMTRDDYERLLFEPNIFIWLNTYGKKSIVAKVDSWPKSKQAFICRTEQPEEIINWSGNIPTKFKLPLKQGCKRADCQLTVAYDGKVRACGLDFYGEQVIGDITKYSINEIWNCEKWKAIRENLRKGIRSGLCAKCDYHGLMSYAYE